MNLEGSTKGKVKLRDVFIQTKTKIFFAIFHFQDVCMLYIYIYIVKFNELVYFNVGFKE